MAGVCSYARIMARRHVTQLQWSDVDPACVPWADTDALALHRKLSAVVVGRDEDVLNDVIVEHCGAWACGWRYSADEGSIGGGVVRAWCCAPHSMVGTDDAIVARAVAGLREWRAWLEHLAGVFKQLAPPREGNSAALDRALDRALTVVLAEVTAATGAGDAWYVHAQQVLRWCLQCYGASAANADSAVSAASRGVFESWVGLDDATAARVVRSITTSTAGHVGGLDVDDVVARHCAVRAQLVAIDTPSFAARAATPRDGHMNFIAVVDSARDVVRAERMRAALRLTRNRAGAGDTIDLDLLRALHAVAVPDAARVRSTDAFAKAGRERYGFFPELAQVCSDALGEADDVTQPVLFRAARAYLDVCCFHPFIDGNARAARLLFEFIIAREHLMFNDVDALFRYPIAGGELPAAQAFVTLVHKLGVVHCTRA